LVYDLKKKINDQNNTLFEKDEIIEELNSQNDQTIVLEENIEKIKDLGISPINNKKSKLNKESLMIPTNIANYNSFKSKLSISL